APNSVDGRFGRVYTIASGLIRAGPSLVTVRTASPKGATPPRALPIATPARSPIVVASRRASASAWPPAAATSWEPPGPVPTPAAAPTRSSRPADRSSGLAEADQLARLLIPELQAGRTQPLAEGQLRDSFQAIGPLVGSRQVVARDSDAEV